MHIQRYPDAAAFLERTQTRLLADEAANSLMLGICFRLRAHPEQIETLPYLATIENEQGLVMAATMTPPHNLLVYRDRPDLSQAPEMIAHNLLREGWNVPGVFGPVEVASEFAAIWAQVSGHAHRAGQHQRVFILTEVIPPRPTPGRLRLAVEGDLNLATEWVLGFNEEIHGVGDVEEAKATARRKIADREFYFWEVDGIPASLAGKTRPTVKGIAVAPVYTPPQFRRRGYATACVAALSQLLLDEGWQFCSLFTDLANPTSNHIYQSIGYRPMCDFDEYVFESRSNRA